MLNIEFAAVTNSQYNDYIGVRSIPNILEECFWFVWFFFGGGGSPQVSKCK